MEDKYRGQRSTAKKYPTIFFNEKFLSKQSIKKQNQILNTAPEQL